MQSRGKQSRAEQNRAGAEKMPNLMKNMAAAEKHLFRIFELLLTDGTGLLCVAARTGTLAHGAPLLSGQLGHGGGDETQLLRQGQRGPGRFGLAPCAC